MKNKIDLFKILHGHEGETFYYYGKGDVVLEEIQYRYDKPYQFEFKRLGYSEYLYLSMNGTFHSGDESLMLFPSKDQRDWEKWDEENNHRIPKTWKELIKIKDIFTECAEICSNKGEDESKTFTDSPIEKSALALLKIHQLIEIGYGGNLTPEEIKTPTEKYAIIHDGKRFVINKYLYGFYHVSFHTEAQAAEFLKYPENIQLLRDYIMV